MKNFTQALVAVLITLPLLASAAGKTASASMQVTFEVKESCNVQTTADSAAAKNGAKAAPAVACQLNSPYLTARNGDKAAVNSGTAANTAVRQDNGAGDWTIYF
ncbi:hypothetical protein [Duganella callida]|uniref:Uncharacterized protein n=1 Tax=Duganella callida TaxID=2561932 RepID=A0A4Y9S4X3_9BURK|nr:hypothetical protein [Duganella callida]TFW16231.1 hypothetical protein E4L98_24230 [Duganella callida]